MRLLVVNAGSSSLKLRLLDDRDAVVDEADVQDWDGDPAVLDEFAVASEPDTVVHRVVHGGDEFDGPALVNDEVEGRIEALVSLAPLHQPRALGLIRHTRKVLPGVPVVACFDTAFHRSLPASAATYALPAEWRRRWGLRRYGFHGLSHSYVARRTVELLGRDHLRLVSCHLGAGASVCAIERGRSVDTSMGFTPLDGLVMATRAGAVDPGLLVWLLTEARVSVEDLGDGLEHRAGLLGLSGTSGDMREVVDRRDRGDEACRLAFDVYVHRLVGDVARMAAALGGMDAITFTGGVGEHSAPLRSAVCDRLGWLGIRLADGLIGGTANDRVLSFLPSDVGVCVVTSREDLEMSRQTRVLLG